MPLADFLSQLNVLDPKKVKVSFEEKENSLRLNVDGKLLSNLTPAKPFPITFPEYVIFRDSYSVDVCIIRNYNELDDDSKNILQSVLDKMYFIPKVVKIERIETSGDEFEWDIMTDKGARIFRTKGRMSIIPAGNRVIITDVNDNVYEIEDVYRLDNKSRKEIQNTI
jgi:ATP-binding cassette subfamily C protein